MMSLVGFWDVPIIFRQKPCHFMIGVYIHHIAYLALAGPRTERRGAGLGNSKYSCYVKLYVTAFE